MTAALAQPMTVGGERQAGHEHEVELQRVDVAGHHAQRRDRRPPGRRRRFRAARTTAIQPAVSGSPGSDSNIITLRDPSVGAEVEQRHDSRAQIRAERAARSRRVGGDPPAHLPHRRAAGRACRQRRPSPHSHRDWSNPVRRVARESRTGRPTIDHDEPAHRRAVRRRPVPAGARPLPHGRHGRHRAGTVTNRPGSRSDRSRRSRSTRRSSASSPRSTATRGRRWRPTDASASTCCATSRPTCAGGSPRAASTTIASTTWPGRTSPTGCPVLPGVLAWIDCEIEHQYEVGDHYFVVGRVVDLAHATDRHTPLVFFKGALGGFLAAE